MAKTVLFDLYGTLVDIRTEERLPELWREMAELYTKNGAPYTAEELQDAYFSTVSAMEGEDLRHDAHEAHPEIEISEVFQKLYTRKGVPADSHMAEAAGAAFRRASTFFIKLYPGAAELLRALRAAGRRVVLLSNAQRIFTLPELRALGIADLFDSIYISSDYGVKKPDRRFFELALREQRIAPETAVMVGNDGTCDIAPARALGLRTLYIRSAISPREPTPPCDWALPEPDMERVGEILLSL